MKKFKVWVHVDTGYQVEVEAKDQEEAEQEAIHNANLSKSEYSGQLVDNSQIGEATILED